MRPESTHDTLRPFTQAQERIAEMLADDLSAPAIALEIGCSYHTVRAHIRMMALILPGETPAQERVRLFAVVRRQTRAA